MLVKCNGSGTTTSCPQPLSVYTGYGNDTVRLVHENVGSIGLFCGAGVDTVTELGRADFAFADCENTPRSQAVCPAGNYAILTQYYQATAPRATFNVFFYTNPLQAPFVEELAAKVTFTTCSNGEIYLKQSLPWLNDLGGKDNAKLDFLGVQTSFRTNKGRQYTSPLAWAEGKTQANPIGVEQEHYDVAAGEFPAKIKFQFGTRVNRDASTNLGVFTRTCTVVAAGTAWQCKNVNNFNNAWATS